MSARVDVVFLGPSLSHDEAREIYPEALYLPPAAMGDIVGVVNRLRPHAIGLIDGTFLTNMSVYHKEVLYAMEQGTWMLGASSMGALRAAECDDYGMIGVGGIYDRLVSGELEDDDEVALTHADASAGFRALSDAMVTIRSAIEGAVAAELLTQDEAATLTALQKERWFPDRRISGILADARDLGIVDGRLEALRDFLRTSVVDPKREDAIAMLHRMRELPEGPVPVEDRVRTVMSGVFSALLARDVAVSTDDGLHVTFDQMRRYAVLHDGQYDNHARQARQAQVLASMAATLGGAPTEEEMLTARVELARRAGIALEALDEWARSQDLDDRGLRIMTTVEALSLRIESSWMGRARMGLITQPLLNEYRLAGQYDQLKSAAALQHRAASGVSFDPEPAPMTLLRTQAALGWQIPDGILAYLDEHDLGTFHELLDTIDTSVRAHYALFGIGLVDDGSDVTNFIEASEPMMTRGS